MYTPVHSKHTARKHNTSTATTKMSLKTSMNPYASLGDDDDEDEVLDGEELTPSVNKNLIESPPKHNTNAMTTANFSPILSMLKFSPLPHQLYQ